MTSLATTHVTKQANKGSLFGLPVFPFQRVVKAGRVGVVISHAKSSRLLLQFFEVMQWLCLDS
jgi:hypothetical protein